eukprot:TRINITY_DN11188_c0_g1_i1.p1 TRINITY_DN11188_c0_g1~~TRINITY_DN11188_c0_g1_i1.p1  ORF type:complete len:415 (-),score=69.67 TRINITY_DN11188_c0_g1_i1:169-1413(-)
MSDDEGGETLFGKIWTYDELLTVDRPTRAKNHNVERPSNWPADTVVDTGKWVFWLPEGWMQGVRTSAAGKTLKCYFNPEGKRFWHRRDIEKALGYALPSVEPAPVKDDGSARVKLVTDPDAIPHWPEDDWLPKDWRIGFRQLPSGLHRIHVPPNQEEGFCYHRASVLEYLSGANTKLSLFGSSKRMADISAQAAENPETHRKERHKHKHKHKHKHTKHKEPPLKIARLEDYETCGVLTVMKVPLDEDATAKLKDAGAPASNDVAVEAKEIHALLMNRGFEEDTELVAVIKRTGEDGPNDVNGLADRLTGIYYARPDEPGERPVYQKVKKANISGGLRCEGLYIYFSDQWSRWKIGVFDDRKASYAFCVDDSLKPTEVDQKWMLLRPEAWQKKDHSTASISMSVDEASVAAVLFG